MWNRSELKSRAREVLRRCFWAAVVVALVSGIFAGEFSGGSRGNNSRDRYEESVDTAKSVWDDGLSADSVVNGVKSAVSAMAVSVMVGINLILLLAGLVITIVIGGPILVGSKRFFMCSRQGESQISTIFYGFGSGNVGNIILTMLLVKVKTFLWGLLLVVPGIIKSYEYRMVPYILSENPGIDQRKAFELSREMMMGQKWEAFVLDLSFILWYILGGFTCGLTNIFYTNPYVAATNAELYAILREDALRSGITNSYELPGFW